MTTESLPRIQVDGAQIWYRQIGTGPPLLVLNGFAATSADWDPAFLNGLASSNELILIDHRGIGTSTDDGKRFDIAQLADDAARVIEALGFERANVLGWSMGGFVAQMLVSQHPSRVEKLILLSTDTGSDAVLASSAVWSQLVDMSGTPQEQARRLLSLLFPSDIAESFYRQFGDIVAAARARLSPELVKRQAAAMDAWHRSGVGEQLKQINAPVLIATGTEDIVIPPSNALKLVNAIPGAWLAQFPGGGTRSWRSTRISFPRSSTAFSQLDEAARPKYQRRLAQKLTAAMTSVSLENGRTLPHSKTWPPSRAANPSLAFWSAVLLHRFEFPPRSSEFCRSVSA